MNSRGAAVVLAAMVSACGQTEAPQPNNVTTEVRIAVPQGERLKQPAAPDRVSAFTELTETKCRMLEENREEGPYWLRRCPGHAGWQLDWSESDLRQGLSLISPNGQETELRLSDLVAKGAFNGLGKTVEWRGGTVNPDALIVRMSVANGVEPRLPDISRLAVVRLKGDPCLVGIVEPGPGQNEEARTIADGPMAECVTD
jgi:hypothetical protein